MHYSYRSKLTARLGTSRGRATRKHFYSWTGPSSSSACGRGPGCPSRAWTRPRPRPPQALPRREHLHRRYHRTHRRLGAVGVLLVGHWRRSQRRWDEECRPDSPRPPPCPLLLSCFLSPPMLSEAVTVARATAPEDNPVDDDDDDDDNEEEMVTDFPLS